MLISFVWISLFFPSVSCLLVRWVCMCCLFTYLYVCINISDLWIVLKVSNIRTNLPTIFAHCAQYILVHTVCVRLILINIHLYAHRHKLKHTHIFSFSRLLFFFAIYWQIFFLFVFFPLFTKILKKNLCHLTIYKPCCVVSSIDLRSRILQVKIEGLNFYL